MAWIKRNLPFVAGGVAALLLLGVAVFYLISNLSADAAVTEELNQQVSELKNMHSATTHPGTETLDNMTPAKADEKRVGEFLVEARKLFVPVPTYPTTDDKGFNNLLLNTIFELQTSASNSGVALPPDYSFTFLAQRGKLAFATNSIEPWMSQLSEIKTICRILFNARVNALDGMRRVAVSTDDVSGNPDYMQAAITTNDVAISTPYEVTFRSFSAEVASVMNGILRATNCLVVKTITVAPSGAIAGASPEGFQQFNPGLGGGLSPSRYGLGRYGGGRSEGLPQGRYGAQNPFNQPQPGTLANPTVPTVFQSEKPLQVTLRLDVVKLKPE